MQVTRFDSLRELVLHFGSLRGWTTQRHIAVACGVEESALSRCLNGEQDLGARRTHALFQEIGIPVELYNLAYTLLGSTQELAGPGRNRAHQRYPELQQPPPAFRRTKQPGTAPRGSSRYELQPRYPVADISFRGDGLPRTDIPAALAIAHFVANRFTGDQIADFFSEMETPSTGHPAGAPL